MNELDSNIINFPEIAKQNNFEIEPCDLAAITPGKYTNFPISKLGNHKWGFCSLRLLMP